MDGELPHAGLLPELWLEVARLLAPEDLCALAETSQGFCLLARSVPVRVPSLSLSYASTIVAFEAWPRLTCEALRCDEAGWTDEQTRSIVRRFFLADKDKDKDNGHPSEQGQHQHEHEHQRLGGGVVLPAAFAWDGCADGALFGALPRLTVVCNPQLVDVAPLARVRHLDLTGCAGVEDVAPLRDVEVLLLSDCPAVRNWEVLGAGSVRRLALSSLDAVADPSCLAGVADLDLSDCDALTDVSSLAHVDTLVLDFCQNLSHVGRLSHVRRLSLWGSEAVTDEVVRALAGHGRLRTLALDNCNVSDVSGLGFLEELGLRGCPQVRDVSALGGLRCLWLDRTGVRDVSALGGLHTLSLSHTDVVDVSALGRVHTLALAGCVCLSDVSALGAVHVLDLRGCKQVQDVGALGGVHTLCLANTDIDDVSALGGNTALDLSNCRFVSDVSTLGAVHDLDLSGCDGLEDVSALGAVRRLSLRSCCGVRDVSALRDVPVLDVSYCHELRPCDLLHLRCRKLTADLSIEALYAM